jgi:hypothetical protein
VLAVLVGAFVVVVVMHADAAATSVTMSASGAREILFILRWLLESTIVSAPDFRFYCVERSRGYGLMSSPVQKCLGSATR